MGGRDALAGARPGTGGAIMAGFKACRTRWVDMARRQDATANHRTPAPGAIDRAIGVHAPFRSGEATSAQAACPA